MIWPFNKKNEFIKNGKFKNKILSHENNDENIFDVIIAGAGPCGATCAYYLSQYCKTLDLKIGLFDKAKFPRDKYCGDAIMSQALTMLEDMGILQELIKENKVVECLHGGFVSPAGHSFVANDHGISEDEKNMDARTYAIKRKILDDRIAKCASNQKGCNLVENALIDTTIFDKETGIWTITLKDNRIYKTRFLVAADGATSNIARKLGIVKDEPQSVAARQYIKGGTHNFKAEGVLLYPTYTVPGYIAIFKHFDDSIDLGAYILPGGPCKNDEIQKLYEKHVYKDPFIARALGDKWEPLERVKVASLRLGGVDKSFSDHILVVGDAAGQTDPLTGEGIHTGMEGGKIAAECICEMFINGDFSEKSCSVYHDRWMEAFGSDFPISAIAGKIVSKLPFLMDAVPIAANGKGGKVGSQFFADFGAVMTGAKPKSLFLYPSVALPLGYATAVQFLKQYILKNEREYNSDPYLIRDKELQISTSWDSQCLINEYIEPEILLKNKNNNKKSDIEKLDDKINNEMFKYINNNNLPILILYGTEYGYAKELAMLFASKINDYNNNNNNTIKFSPRICEYKYVNNLINFDNECIVINICSTSGDGDIPVEAEEFYNLLINNEIIKNNNNNLYQVTLALGDTAYPKFCEAGKLMNNAFLNSNLNCKNLPNCDNNDDLLYLLDGDNTDLVIEWINRTINNLIKSYENNDHIKKFYKEQNYLIKSNETEDDNENNINVDYFLNNAKQSGGLLIDDELATKKNPYIGKIKLKHCLTNSPPNNKNDDKWHIVIDINENDGIELCNYTPGDALGVLPKNNIQQVDLILNFLNLNNNNEIKNLLINELNIKDLSKKLYNILNININDVDYLNEIKDFWFIDFLEKYHNNNNNELNIKLIKSLKPLQPRFYSIASSPIINQGEIHLCVAAVRYETLNKNRKGVCSTYLIDDLNINDEIKIFIQKNPKFRLPKNINKEPIVMVGPGTGIAPFISFINHDINNEFNNNNCMLFFGCRYENGDFLYKEKLLNDQKNNKIDLITAFSRDQKNKIYVQHKMNKYGEKIWNLIGKNNGLLYICGDGVRMSKDVQNEFLNICKTYGKLNDIDAKKLLEERVHLDVWIV